MKVTWPHMGYLNVAVRNLLRDLEIDYAEAPPVTRRTVELGALHSPETVCLPYKVNMGNFLETADQGVDTIITVCGAGKCRLGFYHAVQKTGLGGAGNVRFVTINTDHLFGDLYTFLRLAAPRAGRLSTIRALLKAVRTLKALDHLNDIKNRCVPRAAVPSAALAIYRDGMARISRAGQEEEMIAAVSDTIRSLEAAVPAASPSQPPVRVGLMGEFYTVLEPSINQDVENLLVRQRVEVKRFVHSGSWVYANMLLSALGLYSEEKSRLADARPYLNYHVGGHGLKTAGCAQWCARHGYDGIVHIYPFGCSPEIVARPALRNLSRDWKLPVLTLSLDEHTSNVGVLTRVEAFADCLRRRQVLASRPQVHDE